MVDTFVSAHSFHRCLLDATLLPELSYVLGYVGEQEEDCFEEDYFAQELRSHLEGVMGSQTMATKCSRLVIWYV